MGWGADIRSMEVGGNGRGRADTKILEIGEANLGEEGKKGDWSQKMASVRE